MHSYLELIWDRTSICQNIGPATPKLVISQSYKITYGKSYAYLRYTTITKPEGSTAFAGVMWPINVKTREH